MASGKGSSSRNRLLGLVHIAVKDLQMDDDDYRAILRRETGKVSAAQCSPAELHRVIAAMERLGWRGTRGAGQRVNRASHPIARKARAMWITLHALGAVDDASESVLEAFGKRQLGVDRLHWADQAQTSALIEALKAIAARQGWDMRVPPRLSSAERGQLLSERAVALLQDKLAALGADVRQMDTASLDDQALNRAIVELGARLREAGKAGAS